MPLLTINASNDHVPCGAYPATFRAIENIETERGKAWRWTFQSKDYLITGLSDNESPPTPRNKTGRWLTALSGITLGEKERSVNIDTDSYIGRQYLCIIAPKETGGTKLETFSALAV